MKIVKMPVYVQCAAHPTLRLHMEITVSTDIEPSEDSSMTMIMVTEKLANIMKEKTITNIYLGFVTSVISGFHIKYESYNEEKHSFSTVSYILLAFILALLIALGALFIFKGFIKDRGSHNMFSNWFFNILRYSTNSQNDTSVTNNKSDQDFSGSSSKNCYMNNLNNASHNIHNTSKVMDISTAPDSKKLPNTEKRQKTISIENNMNLTLHNKCNIYKGDFNITSDEEFSGDEFVV